MTERTFGAVYDAEDLIPRKRPPHVVVSLVPVLLKVHESQGDGYKLFLERLFVQPGTELRGNAMIGKLLGDPVHGGMVECATQTVAKGRAPVASNQTS